MTVPGEGRGHPLAPPTRAGGVRAGEAHRRRDVVRVLQVAILLAGLLVWEALARYGDPWLYVPPSAVAPALRDLLLLRSYPDLPAHALLTAAEILAAYALAVAAGVGVGAALGLHRLLGRAFGPVLAALYAVPAVVWYPSLMLILGLDAASKIAFGFLLGFFPVALAVVAGVRQVNPHLVTVARAYGARPSTVFARVMLPSMLGTLAGGLRAGLALCVVGVIVGEILGSKAGLGALINHAYGLARTADYAALVVLTLALVVVSDAGASRLERRAQRWSA